MSRDVSASASASFHAEDVSANTLTPFFKLVFLTLASLTFLSAILNVSVALMVDNPSDEVKSLIETCSTTWKMGFGAIVGLIGGKAI
jgi:hypothetical protein